LVDQFFVIRDKPFDGIIRCRLERHGRNFVTS